VVKSCGTEFHGSLDFLFPKTPDEATVEAISKSEFMASVNGFDFNSNNLTCTLSPLCST